MSDKKIMYCDDCGRVMDEPNEYGDFICDNCVEYCDNCGDYCYGDGYGGLCDDCYEEYLHEDDEDEDEDY